MSTVERIRAILDAEVSIPLKDPAGIINPKAVDAQHRAAGIRRALQEIKYEHESISRHDSMV